MLEVTQKGRVGMGTQLYLLQSPRHQIPHYTSYHNIPHNITTTWWEAFVCLARRFYKCWGALLLQLVLLNPYTLKPQARFTFRTHTRESQERKACLFVITYCSSEAQGSWESWEKRTKLKMKAVFSCRYQIPKVLIYVTFVK